MAEPSGSIGVLEAPPPQFSPSEVASIAAELYGLSGTAVDLGSERDQTFLIDDGGAGGVLKISNTGEDPAVLDLEARAILHIAGVDPELPVARPYRVPKTDATGAAAYRTTADGPSGTHLVRLFERLRGRTGGAELDDAAVFAYAADHARLNIALRGFFDPTAGRELLWNLKCVSGLRPLVGSIEDRGRRALVETVLDRYGERVLPRWPRLRAHVVHGDVNLENVLLDERDRISGIVDFGDTAHSAQAADFAIGLASLLRGRSSDDVFRVGRIAIDGYASRIPFELDELELLGDLVTARLATIVTISAWRVERYPENAEYIQAWDADSWELLELFADTGADRVAQELGAAGPRVRTAALADRRRALLGPALTDLTYSRPVHVVRAEGVWLYDADGRRLLDAYNNVPVVGHCHPRVTEAVVRQTRAVNTHARYLYEPLIELASRLVASMPPNSGLDTVMLVNSGSEANEVAWRLATATGRTGAIVTDFAYHGLTSAVSDLSPEEWPEDFRPSHTETIPLSDQAGMACAIDRLAHSGNGLAATYLDSGFTSDGILVPPPEDVQTIARETRAAGGLLVADEVQAGHGRSGAHLWMFTRYGITPDLVTMGKPMGNGYPVAAVIGRREIFERFATTTRMFSTFGGNPVAAQAALAVFDVIRDERLVENAARVGERLRDALEALRARHPTIRDVRGAGLLVGVELGADAAFAERVVDQMRDDGVLIGRTGRRENVLKIRPPLVFADEHADQVVDALANALAGQQPAH